MSSRFTSANYLSPSGNSNDGITPSPGTLYDGTTVLAANMTTAPVMVEKLDAYSVEIGTPAGSTLVGTFTLQACNERSGLEQTGKPDVQLTDWVTLSFWDVGAGAQAASKAIVSGANAIMLAERACTYRWMRLAFAFTSGTGSPKIVMQEKGWP